MSSNSIDVPFGCILGTSLALGIVVCTFTFIKRGVTVPEAWLLQCEVLVAEVDDVFLDIQWLPSTPVSTKVFELPTVMRGTHKLFKITVHTLRHISYKTRTAVSCIKRKTAERENWESIE